MNTCRSELNVTIVRDAKLGHTQTDSTLQRTIAIESFNSFAPNNETLYRTRRNSA